MPAPLAKGLIVFASLLVAAGIAIYENPEVQAWIERSRRKVAIVLHTLGDEFQPRPQYQAPHRAQSSTAEDRRRWRADAYRNARRRGPGGDGAAPNSSFDNLVNEDGTLRDTHAGRTTGMDNEQMTEVASRRREGLRGFQRGALLAGPFADEMGTTLFEQSASGRYTDEELHDVAKSHEPAAQTTAEKPRGQLSEPEQELDMSNALEYVDIVKACFEDQPEIYIRFLQILDGYKYASTAVSEVYNQVADLFTSEPDLLEGFQRFMPLHASSTQEPRDLYDDPITPASAQAEPVEEAKASDSSSGVENADLIDLMALDPPLSVPQEALGNDVQTSQYTIRSIPVQGVDGSAQREDTEEPLSDSAALSQQSAGEISLLDAPEPLEQAERKTPLSSSVYQSFTSNRSSTNHDTLSLHSVPSSTETVDRVATPTSAVSRTASFTDLAQEMSVTDNGEHHDDDFSDGLSDMEGINTPSTWTEVGSEAGDSEDEARRQV